MEKSLDLVAYPFLCNSKACSVYYVSNLSDSNRIKHIASGLQAQTSGGISINYKHRFQVQRFDVTNIDHWGHSEL